ncbi:MAG: protein kinase [Ktedonobacteraceae bacterium]|nr:protein kinase [Ktedonobacteraceae bacterium]
MDSIVQEQQNRMIGRYQLRQRIGRGGMGEVWQATDTHLGRQVALKLLPSLPVEKRDYLDEFGTEMRAAAMLEHPHILALHDFGEQHTDNNVVTPYLVMPYVPGGTLRKRMQGARGMLAVQLSLSFLKQAALAIDYAHSKQVMHRDIKPENMLLQQDWLLLADFGLAKILSSTSVREKTHAQAGTPAYMAPERLHGQVESSSDLYSLAVIAYELFTGQQPFQGRNPYQIFVQHIQAAPPEPCQLNSSIPEEVSHVLLQGLAKQPQDRPASCTAFVDALQQGWEHVAPSQNDVDGTLLGPRSKRWQAPSQIQSASLEASFPLPIVPSPANMAALPQAEFPPSSVAQGTPIFPANGEGYQPNYDTRPPDNDSRQTAINRSTEDTPSLPFNVAAPKISRRQALIAGAGATALAAGSIATFALLHRPSVPASLPLPGPHKLIVGVPVLSLNGHKDEVWAVKWDPSGRYLVTAGNDENLMLWDIAAALRNSHSAQTLTQPTRTWNVAGVKFENTNGTVCWSSDSRKLIVPQMYGDKAYVLDIAAKTNVPSVYSDQPGINTGADPIYNDICPGPLTNHFTIASENFLHVWRLGQTNAAEKMYYCDKKLNININKLNWSRDGSTLAAIVSDFDGHMHAAFWHNYESAAHIVNLPPRNTHITFFRLVDTVAWSPVNPHMILFSNADVAVIADLKKQELVLALGVLHNPNTPVISGMSWSPNGRYIASSYGPLGDNNKAVTPNPYIYIWDTIPLLKKAAAKAATVDVQPPTLSFAQQGPLRHTNTIIDVQWSPDGRYLATASLDHKVIVWKVDGA